MELYDNLARKYKNTSEEEWKEYADNYIGHSQDIDESLSITIKRNAFIDGFKCVKEKLEIKYFELFKKARQEDKQELIEKACRWLDSINTDYYMDSGIFQMNDLIRDFKKYLEDLK